MSNPPSTTKWFDYIELGFCIPSFLGTIASIYGLWYTISNKLVPPVWLAAIFLIVIVFTVWAYLTKLSKFKVQNAKNIARFCKASHNICHEMRDHFYELFDKWQTKENIDIDEKQKIITDYGAQLLSRAISEATDVNTTVVIKVFANRFLLNENTRNREEMRNKLKNLDQKMVTKSNFRNGEKSEFLPGETKLKYHSLYIYALTDILLKKEGIFIASDTKKFLETALAEASVDTKFFNPEGTIKLTRRKSGAPELTLIEGEKWYEQQKGIIAVPISNEKHQKSDLENSNIFGLIKITVDSSDVFKTSSYQDAFINLAKGFADTMYKCIERLDYYNNSKVLSVS